jgi:hypothetical protein
MHRPIAASQRAVVVMPLFGLFLLLVVVLMAGSNNNDIVVQAFSIPTTTTTKAATISTPIAAEATVFRKLSLLHATTTTRAVLPAVTIPPPPAAISTRRDWWARTTTTALVTTTMMFWSGISPPQPAHAAATATTAGITSADRERLRLGYQQIVYLLDNFEQETTTCRDNGGECKRDADNIRRVLGLRSTTDPLFQIEKVFGKVKNDESIDVEQLDDFYAATEDWTSAINMSNSMAFISQFGEYNPGGGKDEVLKYLLESQKQLILARDALQTICTVLNVKV